MNYFCSKDCPDLCAFSAEKVDGEYKFTGVAEKWQETGFVCSKFKVFAKREIDSAINSYKKEDEAIIELFDDEAIEEMSSLLEEYSGKKILYMRGSGSLAYNMCYWDVFFSKFDNCFNISGNPCDETGGDAHEADFGDAVNPPLENLENADTIIIYGKNSAVCSQHFYAYLKTLKKKGKKIIYLDPVKTKSADLADRFIMINPGCDGLLACAILTELGHEEGYSTSELIERAGISQDDFSFILDAVKKTNCAHVQGFGIQRHTNGMNAFQWINRLAVKTDTDNMLYYGHGSKRFWQGQPKSFKGSVHVDKIAEMIPEFDLFICVAANPVMTFPDTHLWKESLEKTKTIVIDTNHTETSEFADFFLKVGGMFSQDDFMASYFFEHDHKRERLIESMSDTDAVLKLSEKLGFDIQIIKQENIPARSPKRSPYKTETLELTIPELYDGFQLITSSHQNYLNSQTLPGMEEGLQVVYINTEDASTLGFINGDDIKVTGEKGCYVAEAIVTDDIKKGCVMSWKNIPMKEGFLNNVIPHKLTDSGNGLVYYTHFVNLEKA